MMVSCGVAVPKDAEPQAAAPSLFPDYTGVTVPCNIAPLNFMLTDSLYGECVARFSTPNGESVVAGGQGRIEISQGDWESLLEAAKGASIGVELYAQRLSDEKWVSFPMFGINVSADAIDPYITYRLLTPSYEAFQNMAIMQRDLTCFDEKTVYDTRLLLEGTSMQCVNCHCYQNYSAQNMLLHSRRQHLGTLLVRDGKASLVNFKALGLPGAGTYPAWHPTLPVIALSNNTTNQAFYTKDKGRIEVYDSESDLYLYLLDENKIQPVGNPGKDAQGQPLTVQGQDEMETFPTWSPDGKWLYYCMATFHPNDAALTRQQDVRYHYSQIRYDIYRRAFNAEKRQFGEAQLVYKASEGGHSATLPRISPDGRYLLFAQGPYGCFQIWHPEADICMIDLQKPLPATSVLTLPVNSDMAESYPTWSSNGRWVMFDSRRDDGTCSHVYIAHVDANGQFGKAFLLPQSNPGHDVLMLKSYNRPEFTKDAVDLSSHTLASTFAQSAE